MARTIEEISSAIDSIFYGYMDIPIKNGIKNATIQQQKKHKKNLKRKDPTRLS